MSAVQEVDRKLAELEASPRKPEEEEYIQACLDATPEEEKPFISELDLLTTVRGYATYEPRKEETAKAFKVSLDISFGFTSPSSYCQFTGHQ